MHPNQFGAKILPACSATDPTQQVEKSWLYLVLLYKSGFITKVEGICKFDEWIGNVSGANPRIPPRDFVVKTQPLMK